MKYFLLIMMPIIFISCQKGISDNQDTDNTPDSAIDCYLLKQGLKQNDIETITQSLGKLLDEQYSKENLSKLAATISADCNVAASLECFDCIKTNPPQSQMRLSFLEDNSDSIVREINITLAAETEITLVKVY